MNIRYVSKIPMLYLLCVHFLSRHLERQSANEALMVLEQ